MHAIMWPEYSLKQETYYTLSFPNIVLETDILWGHLWLIIDLSTPVDTLDIRKNKLFIQICCNDNHMLPFIMTIMNTITYAIKMNS